MLRNIVGVTLVVIGGFVMLVLLMSGGPLFPHLIGPITFAVIGVLLLVRKSKAKESRTD